jgi:hypothetical protein
MLPWWQFLGIGCDDMYGQQRAKRCDRHMVFREALLNLG